MFYSYFELFLSFSIDTFFFLIIQSEISRIYKSTLIFGKHLKKKIHKFKKTNRSTILMFAANGKT